MPYTQIATEQELLRLVEETLTIQPEDLKLPYLKKGDLLRRVIGLANRLRNDLTTYNISGKPICLCTDNKVTILAAILAALAGGPKVAIPHSLSDSVIQQTIRNTHCTLALSDEPLLLPEGVYNMVVEENGLSDFRYQPVRTLTEPIVSLFTGGSTGRPKLWDKSALNLFGEAIFLRQRFELGPDDVFLATVPPHHIYGLLFSVLLPFVCRARCVGEVPYFPREILRGIGEKEATVFIGSPMHYKALSEESIPENKLRVAFSSGGFLEESHGKYFYEQAHVNVVEVYGSTETGGIATRCRANGESRWTVFSGIDWRIKNERLQVNSMFLSPSLPRNKDGFFVTGDRVANLENDASSFILLGRADGIVKIGGKRIDLMEVETRIKSLSMIDDAYIFAVPSRSGREHELAALIVSQVEETQLRRLFSDILDPLLIPRRIKCVEAIPGGVGGKRDHQASLNLITH